MASALSALTFDDQDMLPGRMVNVAAHATLQLREPCPRWFRVLEDVLAERARAERSKLKPAPAVYLNVTRLAVLGDIGMELNTARFGAGQVRIEVPTAYAVGEDVPTQVTTVLVFDSGKLIFTGGENEFVTQFAAWQFALMMTTRFQIPTTLVGFRINNIVFNFFLNFNVDLRRIQKEQDALCAYDPVKFPAVVYKFAEKFKALINYTGRVIITGARNRAIAHDAYRALYEKLRDFRTDAAASAGSHREPACATDERAESYMRMNRQFAAVMQTFSETDLVAIDRDAPEFRLGHFMDACRDRALPAPPAPTARKK